jgi:GT2 family glycosyltransferase
MNRIGVVAIGRNEGERLERCLQSVMRKAAAVVYVDSGSTDASVALAQQLRAEVLELDTGRAFSAARARNEGFARLMNVKPAIDFVQFVDGDCEVVGGWLEKACDYLAAHSDVAVVCGRRRERHRDTSIYNRLCDIEWDTPVGEASECGGDAMMRAAAFGAIGGFDPIVIAGEEPELCARLRGNGWKIVRLDADMTLHDAAMMHFGQWWRRCLRAGYAQAQAAALHGASRRTHWGKSVWSAWFWGLAIPIAILVLLPVTHGRSAMALLVYPLLAIRIANRAHRRELSGGDRWLYAGACVIGKLPEMLGQVKFLLSRVSGRPSAIIEYKRVRTA